MSILKRWMDRFARASAIDALPVQAARTITVEPRLESLDAWIALATRESRQGVRARDSLYFPAGLPAINLAAGYPPNVGFKVLARARRADAGQILLAGNVLYLEGLAPRIYDYVEVRSDDAVWPVFVLEHLPGRAATAEERRSLGDRIARVIALAEIPNDAREIVGPNDALLDGKLEPKFLSFQRFRPELYEYYLEKLALAAADATHFGNLDRRGRRYLYQAVPGLRHPAKRNIAGRVKLLSRLMERAGVSLKEKLVLDVGCNLGMMIAEYLRAGARWCHGWDMPEVIGHTERLLPAIGCTRFSCTAAMLTRDRPLEADLPAFLQPALAGCVISYLAIRGHLGWCQALARIPWEFLIYEGHKSDTPESLRQQLAELRQAVAFETGPVEPYQDGSRPRQMTVLVRRP